MPSFLSLKDKNKNTLDVCTNVLLNKKTMIVHSSYYYYYKKMGGLENLKK